jgi:WD40 repeat protein
VTLEAPPRLGNPYVGPTSFRLGDPLYGRDQERQDLLDLLIAERIVLLYSPSGAGKTSLIQAALVPALRDAGFDVLPVIRVTHALEPRPGMPTPRNRYVMGTLLSLEEGVPPELQRPVGELATLTLREYLTAYGDRDHKLGNEVLIFDQFEEVLTADPTDEPAKHEFFREVGEALRDRGLWALFSMREDFLAAMDPYLRHVPTRFRSTFRLDLLSVPEALDAIRLPALQAHVDFTEEAAEQLVDDLRRVRVQRPGGAMEEALGSSVEPVQLQVAGRLLWSMLPSGAERITPADVEALGRVDQALADYYADRVRTAAERTGVREAAVREWFETRLITPQGLRGEVLDGPAPGASGAALLSELVDAHLIRAETRRHATWFELAHDRLIEPVRRNNASWRSVHLTSFERAAMIWEDEGRPDRMLLLGADLTAAERDPAVVAGPLKPREQEFLQASRRVDTEQRRERRTTRRLRAAVALVTLLAVLSGVFLVQSRTAAGHSRDQATENRLLVGAHRAATWDQGLAVRLAAAAAEQSGSGSLDRQTREVLYQVASASPVALALRGRGPAWAVDLSEDGSTAVTAGSGGLQLWDRATGARRQALRVPDAEDITGLDISEDAGTVIAGFTAGDVLVWDVGSDRTKRWTGDVEDMWALYLSPRGDELVTVGSGKNLAQVWDLRGNLQFDLVQPDATRLNDAAFSPDGGTLVTAGDGPAAALWDAVAGTQTGSVPLAGEINTVTVSADGRMLGTVDTDGFAAVVDIASGQELRQISSAPVSDYVRMFNPDLSRLVTVYTDGHVWVDDVAKNEVIAGAFVPGAHLTGGGFDARDQSQVIVMSQDGEPAFWQTRPGGEFDSVLAVAPGSRTFVAWDDGSLREWDGAHDQTAVSGDSGNYPFRLAADRSGARLVTTGYSGEVQVWDTETGQALQTLVPPDGYFVDAALTPDGQTVVTGDSAGQVIRWDAATGQQIDRLYQSDYAVSQVAVSPDGSQVLAVDQLESESQDAGRPVARLLPLPGPGKDVKLQLESRGSRPEFFRPETVTAAAFTRDGKSVVVGTSEGRLVSFDTRTGHRSWQAAEAHHDLPVVAVTTGPHGQIVSTGSDQRAVVSDSSGRLTREVASDKDLLAAAFTPDGREVALFAEDGGLSTVPLSDAALVRMVRGKMVRDLTPEECRRYRPSQGC